MFSFFSHSLWNIFLLQAFNMQIMFLILLFTFFSYLKFPMLWERFLCTLTIPEDLHVKQKIVSISLRNVHKSLCYIHFYNNRPLEHFKDSVDCSKLGDGQCASLYHIPKCNAFLLYKLCVTKYITYMYAPKTINLLWFSKMIILWLMPDIWLLDGNQKSRSAGIILLSYEVLCQ